MKANQWIWRLKFVQNRIENAQKSRYHSGSLIFRVGSNVDSSLCQFSIELSNCWLFQNMFWFCWFYLFFLVPVSFTVFKTAKETGIPSTTLFFPFLFLLHHSFCFLLIWMCVLQVIVSLMNDLINIPKKWTSMNDRTPNVRTLNVRQSSYMLRNNKCSRKLVLSFNVVKDY